MPRIGENSFMPLRLLCVCAHPDDECFAFGGALALAAMRGVDCSLLCFTSGDAGSYRGNTTSREELAAVRREELAASCDVLGIAHHEVLGYSDGTLADQPLSTLARDVVARIRTFRPQVVLTFGGDGALNTHPDHQAVSAASTAAFHWAGHPKRCPELGALYQPQRLFYVTSSFYLPDRPQPLTTPWTLTLDVRSVFEQKQRAFAAHTTQAPLMHQTEPVFREHGMTEYYTLIASPTPQPATQSRDMFEALMDTA
jgi:LmbE family N-acetylglucosaminyl deacetylase